MPTCQIFLSYARKDKAKVEELYQKLSEAGFKPWMDTKDILPGERWRLAIPKAIRSSDFFLVCLSVNSVDKRGWIQKEIKEALDIWQGMLDSDIYLIPVRLEDCKTPESPESLRYFQWVDLFEEDGWSRLVKAIREGMKRRGMAVPVDVETQRMEEDHQRAMRLLWEDFQEQRADAIERRDARALIRAQRQYEKQRRRAEEDYQVSVRRRNED